MAHQECQEAGIAAADGTPSAFALGLGAPELGPPGASPRPCSDMQRVFHTCFHIAEMQQWRSSGSFATHEF